MPIAIVTGASSGLGREFVRQIAVKESVEEIWVIARRKERLRDLAADSDAKIVPIEMDLTNEEEIERLRICLEREKPDIALLVNAAGLGKTGTYRQIPYSSNRDMVNINCRALMEVTILALPYMGRGGRILEICSSSAFQPLPGLNVYAATKAFVLSYSRGLRWELFGRGIKVTAVCPYWIKDTEFIDVAEHTGHQSGVRHYPFASRAKNVVRWALFDSRLNLPVSTPGPVCFIQRIFSKFIPHEIVIAVWELIRRI